MDQATKAKLREAAKARWAAIKADPKRYAKMRRKMSANLRQRHAHARATSMHAPSTSMHAPSTYARATAHARATEIPEIKAAIKRLRKLTLSELLSMNGTHAHSLTELAELSAHAARTTALSGGKAVE